MMEELTAQARRELVEALIDNTPVAYVILDREYKMRYLNRSFAALRGLDMDAVLGEKCYNVSNAGVRCGQCAVAKALEQGKKAFVRRKDWMPDGQVRFIDDYAIPLQRNNAGEVEYVLEMMIDRTKEMVAREQKNGDYDETLSILSALLEAKDAYTAEHSDSVRRISSGLAIAMGLSPDEIFEISVAASLHDIGKLHVPDTIINKPGKLSDEEFEVIKAHPVQSYEMLEGLSSFQRIRHIARHHHERVDGLGYPDGLRGEALSIGAKIVAVADTYDAITSTRPYRKAHSQEFALEELRRVSGTQLDPEVVEVLCALEFREDGPIFPRERVPGAPLKKRERVERQVPHQAAQKERKLIPHLLGGDIDRDRLLGAIFQNTPCGYFVLGKHCDLLFASDYFFTYFSLEREATLGDCCEHRETGGRILCKDCTIQLALDTGKVHHKRQETEGHGGLRIFDVYSVPLQELGGPGHLIGVMLDRTQEGILERSRHRDFQRLVELLQDLLEHQKDGSGGASLSQKITLLEEKLRALLMKNSMGEGCREKSGG